MHALTDVAHANTKAGTPEGVRGIFCRDTFGWDAETIVFYFENQAATDDAAAEGDGAAVNTRLKPMLDAVFDKGLEEHAGNDDIERFVGDLLDDAKFFAEADDFDGEVVVDEAELLTQGDEGVAVLKQNAKDVRQLADHLAGEIWFEADERGDGVKGVEEEVGIDLSLQSVEPGFKKKPSLLFKLAFDPDGVPDFEWNADDDGG